MVKLSEYKMEGEPSLFYREGSMDQTILMENLGQNPTYQYPPTNPKVVFDIGANIGITAVVMARLYPNATIYAFEPVPENFAILLKNTEAYPNIKPFNYGLGNQNAILQIYASDHELNHGGYSTYTHEGVDLTKSQPVEIRNINDVVKELNVDIDVIKIDAEGAEHDVLTGLNPEARKKVGWIFGEMHGVKDFTALGVLEEDFDFSLQKQMGVRLFNFYAMNRSLMK